MSDNEKSSATGISMANWWGKGWWNHKQFAALGQHYHELIDQAKQALIQDALTDSNKMVFDVEFDGVFVEDTTLDQLIADIKEAGYRQVTHSPVLQGDTSRALNFISDHGAVEVWVNDGDAGFRAVTSTEADSEKMAAIAKKFIGPKVSAGRVYVLIHSDEGPKLSPIGVAAIPLERGNYEPKVLQDFDHIVEDLQTDAPCGRLVIFDGQPGTGKTYLVRALLEAVPKALFVIVPAHIIPELSSPGMVKALVEARKSKGNLPTIFIVEDADDCLTPRASDNVNAVSALLNLGDGILGAMMDIRLICTTNAKSEELDEAVMRPGRLCRMVRVDSLSQDVAAKLYHRLTGETASLPKNTTLAEVYRLARDKGWKPEKKKRMGFVSETPEDY